MTLREILVEKKVAVCERWQDAILGEYGEVTAVRWRRERDPFANPVGHALTTGLPALFEAVIGDGEPGAAAVTALEAIVRIRSIQDLTPSRAVGFVYRLRDAVRDELAPELARGGHAADLAAFDDRVERLAFRAFDTYVRFREQVYRLRQEELKRSVASLLRRWHGSEVPEPAPEVVRLSPPPQHGVPR